MYLLKITVVGERAFLEEEGRAPEACTFKSNGYGPELHSDGPGRSSLTSFPATETDKQLRALNIYII